jgi:hypothetical protein
MRQRLPPVGGATGLWGEHNRTPQTQRIHAPHSNGPNYRNQSAFCNERGLCNQPDSHCCIGE